MRIQLLGSPSVVTAGGEQVPGLGPGKPLAILALLALRGPMRRAELVSLLWGEAPEARARNAFRQTLHRLRNAVPLEVGTDGRELVALPNDGLTVDVERFERALAAGELETAVDTYRGDFLDGFELGERAFDSWADDERTRLRGAFSRALGDLASATLARGDWETGITLSRRLVAATPLDRSACEREVRALVSAGRTNEAAAAAAVHADRLDAELGPPTGAELRALAHRILTSDRDAALPASARARPRAVPFVGRQRELSKMLAMWENARNEHGGAVVIDGVAGIGKSRLVSEFSVRVRTLGRATILAGHERGDWNIPYAGFGDAMRAVVRSPAVAGASRHLLAEAARLLPELRDRFELPDPAPLEDEAGALRFFEGIAALLEAVAYEKPLLVTIEDFHRASRQSLHLAAYLLDRLASASVLFVFTATREEGGDARERKELEEFSALLISRARDDERAAVLPLGPLPEDEAVDLWRAALPRDSGETADRAAVSSARGNPATIIALARGELAPQASAVVGVRDLVHLRLQRFGPSEQRLYAACALFGRSVPLRLLAAASHLSEVAALDAAAALERAGLVIQEIGGIAAAHAEAALFAEEGAGPAGVVLLAGWTADALRAEPVPDAAELTRLYTIAGRGTDAAAHVKRAAFEAAVTGSHHDAVGLLRGVLSLALPESTRLDLEKALTAFGAGRRRIPTTPAHAHGGKRESSADTESPGDAEVPPKLATQTPPRRLRPAVAWIAAAGISAAVAIAAAYLVPEQPLRARGAYLSDTLVMAEGTGRGARLVGLTGALLPAPTLAGKVAAPNPPLWLGTVTVPWINPKPSPRGDMVAIERVTPAGTDIFLLARAGLDTIPLVAGEGDDIALGWSPDGAWLLTLRLRLLTDGSEDGDLFAVESRRRGRVLALDTLSLRSVTGAVWSPAGDRVAWSARLGPMRQQDVFAVGFPGGAALNVSSHASEDYRPAWSPDGTLLAFTSERDGNAELYGYEFEPERQLRRLTNDPASDDRAAFSPDGAFLAFESTRGGEAGVWVMPALGGVPLRVSPSGASHAISEWRPSQPAFVDMVVISGPEIVSIGDTVPLRARLVDRLGRDAAERHLEWSVSGRALRPLTNQAGASSLTLVAERAGTARVSARLGGWREGGTSITVARAPVPGFEDDFETGQLGTRWRVLGEPLPRMATARGKGGSTGVLLAADRAWQSGILSEDVIVLGPGVRVDVWVSAPFSAAGAARSLVVALADDIPPVPTDAIAPSPFRLAQVSWQGESGRLSYGAGREGTTEPASFLEPAAGHTFSLEMDDQGRVSALVDGRRRWTSSARLLMPGDPTRARVWIGGVGIGDEVVIDAVRVTTR